MNAKSKRSAKQARTRKADEKANALVAKLASQLPLPTQTGAKEQLKHGRNTVTYKHDTEQDQIYAQAEFAHMAPYLLKLLKSEAFEGLIMKPAMFDADKHAEYDHNNQLSCVYCKQYFKQMQDVRRHYVEQHMPQGDHQRFKGWWLDPTGLPEKYVVSFEGFDEKEGKKAYFCPDCLLNNDLTTKCETSDTMQGHLYRKHKKSGLIGLLQLHVPVWNIFKENHLYYYRKGIVQSIQNSDLFEEMTIAEYKQWKTQRDAEMATLTF